MSQAVVDRLVSKLGPRIVETRDAFGDHEVVVAVADWVELAELMRHDEQVAMDHFIDMTAIDYPERASARFDLVLSLRASGSGARVRARTYVKDGEKVGTLSSIWAGANWAEREVWDMFGIEFEGHPDLRRILLYDEFIGYPLRKDYPIDKAQPLVPYRDVSDIEKLPPFGIEEGQPFARIDWESRLAGRDEQVSPAIGVQQGQRRALSDSEAAQRLQRRIAERLANETNDSEASEKGAGD